MPHTYDNSFCPACGHLVCVAAVAPVKEPPRCATCGDPDGDLHNIPLRVPAHAFKAAS